MAKAHVVILPVFSFGNNSLIWAPHTFLIPIEFVSRHVPVRGQPMAMSCWWPNITINLQTMYI